MHKGMQVWFFWRSRQLKGQTREISFTNTWFVDEHLESSSPSWSPSQTASKPSRIDTAKCYHSIILHLFLVLPLSIQSCSNDCSSWRTTTQKTFWFCFRSFRKTHPVGWGVCRLACLTTEFQSNCLSRALPSDNSNCWKEDIAEIWFFVELFVLNNSNTDREVHFEHVLHTSIIARSILLSNKKFPASITKHCLLFVD